MGQQLSFRAAEFHHGLNLDNDGIASQDRLKEIFNHASQNDLTHIILGESCPLGLSRLVKYLELPGLADRLNQHEIDQRHQNFEKIAKLANNLDLRLFANFNPMFYPAAFVELFPETIAVSPKGEERSFRYDPSTKKAICPEHPDVQNLLRIQAREILSLPGIEGISCWLNMSDCLLFFCNCDTCKSLTIGQTIANFANLIYGECAGLNKRLNIRTYLGSWQCGLETNTFLEAAPLMHPDIELTYKQQQGDMYNEHPINPLIGQLKPHKEYIEFDTYGEYRGQSIGIVCSCRKQMQERMKIAAEAGVDGAIVRGMHHIHPFSLDADLFAALALEPDLDIDQWSIGWLNDRFGESAEGILYILDLAWEVCRRSMYIRGVNWASWSIPQTLDRIRFILYDRSAPCVDGAFESLKIDDRMLADVAESHQEAIDIAEDLCRHCDALKTSLDEENYQSLQASMQVLLAYSSLVKLLIQSVLRAFQWERLESATMREFRRFDLLDSVALCKEQIGVCRKQLLTINFKALEPLMGPIELIPLSAEERLMQPLDHAKQVCADIQSMVDVQPASFTGIVPWPERWSTNSTISDFGDKQI